MRTPALILLACVSFLQSCARTPAVTAPSPGALAPLDLPGLHNLVTYAPGLVVGSAPENPEAYDALASMGVRTIITVDGAAPDLTAAHSRGLRYIHLPIGYDGMDEHRTLELARAIQDARQQGVVYLHCHHGKHRAAGAAAAACVTLGLLDHAAATEKMHISQTSPDYRGLFAAVTAATPASSAQLAAVNADFPEAWRPTGLVATMVEVDSTFDRLSDVERAGWTAPTDHPDLVPVAEAGRLADLLRVMRNDPEAKDKPDDFEALRARAAAAAQHLEDGLTQQLSTDDLSARMKAVGASCKSCHVKYRDRH